MATSAMRVSSCSSGSCPSVGRSAVCRCGLDRRARTRCSNRGRSAHPKAAVGAAAEPMLRTDAVENRAINPTAREHREGDVPAVESVSRFNEAFRAIGKEILERVPVAVDATGCGGLPIGEAEMSLNALVPRCPGCLVRSERFLHGIGRHLSGGWHFLAVLRPVPPRVAGAPQRPFEVEPHSSIRSRNENASVAGTNGCSRVTKPLSAPTGKRRCVENRWISSPRRGPLTSSIAGSARKTPTVGLAVVALGDDTSRPCAPSHDRRSSRAREGCRAYPARARGCRRASPTTRTIARQKHIPPSPDSRRRRPPQHSPAGSLPTLPPPSRSPRCSPRRSPT